jgi:SEC-C motif
MKLSRNDPCHCGSGKKYKKCCLLTDEQPIASQKTSKPSRSTIKQDAIKNDAIMATLTGEYAQPVRLCYKLHDKQALHRKIFAHMKCMSYDPIQNRWVWLFDHEAKKLVFEKKYQDIPKHLHPIVIGSFFSDSDDELHLDVRSHERALHAIAFFDRYIPRNVAEITDAIVLNSLIAAKDMGLLNDFDNFFKDIPIVDKAKEFDDMLESTMTKAEKLDFLLSSFDKDADEPIPDVEKLRIHYYEDGIDSFRYLLKLKSIVAMNKRNGKDMTQNDILKIMLNGQG